MSLWTLTAGDVGDFAPLDRRRAVDVVVIGAGIAGLMTAYRLSRDGADVVVLERDGVGGGVTAKTTAKVTALHGTIYQRIRAGKGAEAAAIYGQANQAAVDELASVASSLGIDCEFTRASAWTYATTAAGRRRVEAEVAAAQAAGLPASYGNPHELPFDVAGGVQLPDQAHFNPVAFCSGIAQALPADTVHAHTPVSAVDGNPGGVTVHTAGGHQVSADQVVVTTHAPIVDPAFLTSRMRPSRSYAAAVELSSGEVPVAMYLNVESPTHSMRPAVRDGRAVLVVGGYGHPVGDADTSDQQRQLEAWARAAFDVATVTDRWSAHDHLTSDGVPFIGRLAPRDTRRWVATGFGKWGITTSAVAAGIIADGIAGRANPSAELFDATRLVPTVTRSLASATARIVHHFVGDRLRARKAAGGFRADELEPGTGQVVHIRGRAAAVCREDDGTVHAVSARCTHLGCLVGFNHADRTWDCPCHGSRFSSDGQVLQGPATTPLSAVEI